MARPVRYKTQQMQELVKFFQSIPGQHVTVNEIDRYFRAKSIKVGLTTIYRNLDRLVESGDLVKYTVDGANSAYYEYRSQPEDSGEETHFHCMCNRCGNLIHLECGEIDEFEDHLLRAHGFQVDSSKTVFYGLCSRCRKN